jgi:hypothetical protein
MDNSTRIMKMQPGLEMDKEITVVMVQISG